MTVRIELHERVIRDKETLKNQLEELKAQRDMTFKVMKQMDGDQKKFVGVFDIFMFRSLGLTLPAAMFIGNNLK